MSNCAADTSGRKITVFPALHPEKEQPIGLFGRRHLDYLKQHRRVAYINLLISGNLNTYIADIDRQAQERFEQLNIYL